MSNVKIEVNGLDIIDLASKLDNLTNALTSKNEATTEAKKEKLLTRLEVCELLGITLPTVHDWTQKGILKAYRIGNRLRFKHSEIMQDLENNLITKKQ